MILWKKNEVKGKTKGLCLLNLVQLYSSLNHDVCLNILFKQEPKDKSTSIENTQDP